MTLRQRGLTANSIVRLPMPGSGESKLRAYEFGREVLAPGTVDASPGRTSLDDPSDGLPAVPSD